MWSLMKKSILAAMLAVIKEGFNTLAGAGLQLSESKEEQVKPFCLSRLTRGQTPSDTMSKQERFI